MLTASLSWFLYYWKVWHSHRQLWLNWKISQVVKLSLLLITTGQLKVCCIWLSIIQRLSFFLTRFLIVVANLVLHERKLTLLSSVWQQVIFFGFFLGCESSTFKLVREANNLSWLEWLMNRWTQMIKNSLMDSYESTIKLNNYNT